MWITDYNWKNDYKVNILGSINEGKQQLQAFYYLMKQLRSTYDGIGIYGLSCIKILFMISK